MTREIEVPIPSDSCGIQRSRIIKIVGVILTLPIWSFFVWRNIFIHPHKPRFTLQDVTLYNFNVTVDPSSLSSAFQATIWSRNPNAWFGLYYNTMGVYATYENQQVTSRTEINTTYQGHKSEDLWTVLVAGTSVPVAPQIGAALNQNWGNGVVVIMIKLDGHVRWKLGSLAKGGNHITVLCPAYITFGPNSTGISLGNNASKYQLFHNCDVNLSK
ncbi:hypothetical protein CDL15_Pgr002270 [Punica granatum]|uniref:Late embryogenesis abundant protein LEA-2 subgroup domain-containing protein n=1 Tax=Punica granatum TaxID=22663 RepID=A0A218WG45_PUNGR|nr:hypothetical protein CDL15_Pgr002270 [Punica granatum]